MHELNVINNINYVGNWIVHNRIIFLNNHMINIIFAITIMILGFIIAKILSIGIKTVLSSKHIDTTISEFLSTLSKYIIITCSTITSLSYIGVQTTSVIAILGAAGMAIGLALQGSLSNFSSGILLILLSPLRTGEYVVLGKATGTVLNIHIFYTTLRTLDGKIIIVPNNKITSNNIINYSREPYRRNEFVIHIPYNANVDTVIQILKKVIHEEPKIIQEKDIIIGLSKFDSYAMRFIIRCWSNTNDLNTVYWDVMSKIKKALDDNKITISYSVLNINVIKNKKI
ncbi:mechanosensitive ion channel domain-containing protein [Buchnera aphidicola]|uniref:Small-conductance mechanosensitive channel n=2 Tax=Buchnera aphidicola TaxID=9 RepID=A0A4D6YKP8_9GAMM|nr:mechanosensitive ion channel protein MscS [Buchnera aphidicola (Stegophylla sp.)]